LIGGFADTQSNGRSTKRHLQDKFILTATAALIALDATALSPHA
jgi:hypothetical protein